MGVCYEDLSQWDEAKKVLHSIGTHTSLNTSSLFVCVCVCVFVQCLKRAIALKDPEGTALIKLAK